MSIKKKVAIVFTGGTISMTVDDKVGQLYQLYQVNKYYQWLPTLIKLQMLKFLILMKFQDLT